MPKAIKFILGLALLCATIFFSWYFVNIIAYVLIAAVISFLGDPIINLLGKIKIKGKTLNSTIKSALTLIFIWTLFILFFKSMIPLVVNEINTFNNINTEHVATQLQEPIQQINTFLLDYGIIDNGFELHRDVSIGISRILDTTLLTSWFSSAAGTLGNIIVALFSITFISFFFLKDSYLFSKMIMALVPYNYEERVVIALASIQKLLVRYFGGLFIEILGVMVLNTIGLIILGISFNHAIVIGLVTGFLNLIPYIGPLIGQVFGLVVGLLIGLEAGIYTNLIPYLSGIFIVLVVTQIVDNVIFQPLIYGNSVYAHPLEIFLVILMAGQLAGIVGMMLAIPSYTLIRVILREFFNEYKLIQKLTQSLDKQEK